MSQFMFGPCLQHVSVSFCVNFMGLQYLLLFINLIGSLVLCTFLLCLNNVVLLLKKIGRLFGKSFYLDYQSHTAMSTPNSNLEALQIHADMRCPYP